MNRAILSASRNFIRSSAANTKFSTSSLYLSESKSESENMDKFKNNPYFDKYRDKLKAVYDEDPEKFQESLKPQKVEPIGNPEDYGIKVKSKMSASATKKRTLDSIMKIDKVAELEPEAIKAIWITFISELSKFPGMISDKEYETIAKRSSEFTTFIFPLPREQGYEFILAQWAGHECHFTPLINFQAHGENAPSIMTVVYFDELLESKKISLEMTEVDSNNLKPEEAKFLIHLMKSYYIDCEDGDAKNDLMKRFTYEPAKFDHMDTIEMLKKDGLNIEQFKTIINIEEATKGVLERVESKNKVETKKPEPAKEDRYKEKDLADFS